MASHAPAPHLPAESECPTLRSLISFFGAGPGQPKPESVTVVEDDETVSGQLPPLPPRDGLLLGTVSAVGKSIRAFTRNDLFKSVLPNAIFGITAAIADIHLRGGVEDIEARSIFAEIVKRFPVTYLFNFCALLIFHLGTQRPREHIARGRWWITAANDSNEKLRKSSSSSSSSAGQIRRAYLLLLPLTLALNRYFGVWHEGLMINLLTFIYNDLINRSSSGKHEQPPFVRDIILGITFGYINSASLKIALTTTTTTTTASAGSIVSPHGHTWTWLNIVSVLIATTIGCQEFKTRHRHNDHAQPEGHQDSSSSDINTTNHDGKPTTPNPRKKALAIFLGEAAVPRAQLAMMMPLWTLICAVFWGLKWPVAAAFVAYSLFVASRVLTQRTVGAEERTWRFWKRWMVVVYLFPVVAVLSAAP